MKEPFLSELSSTAYGLSYKNLRRKWADFGVCSEERLRCGLEARQSLLILGSKKHSSGYLRLLFTANITENLNSEVFSIGGSSRQLAHPPLPGVGTVLLWFPYLVIKTKGESFVPIFNVKVHES